MKEKFLDHNFKPGSLAKIEMVNAMLDEQRAMDKLPLTLRELYYLLVGKALIPNTTREYKNLSSLLTNARMAGLVDWGDIEDRLRVADKPYGGESASQELHNLAADFALDRQMGQRYHIEVWTEKDAMSSILQGITYPFHIPLVIDRGYGSSTVLYEASNRLLEAGDRGQECVMLYVGDHDPSGLNMLEDIEQRLSEFGVPDVEIIHVALTLEQVHKYHLPHNPAKVADPRAKAYIAKYGHKSWEADALKALAPGVIEELISEEIAARLDFEKYEGILEQEKEDRRRLQRVADDFEADNVEA